MRKSSEIKKQLKKKGIFYEQVKREKQLSLI